MMDTSMHSEPSPIERAVYVEACQDGVNPATMVRIVYKGRDDERTLFDTLEDALAFAQSLCEH